jgi:hypothetical protein
MTGTYIDPLDREIKSNGNMSIPIRSFDGSKVIHKINIQITNGNINKVSR